MLGAVVREPLGREAVRLLDALDDVGEVV